MMEEVGTYPAQPGELVAGRLGRPDLRQHVERPGREPRQRPVAARAGDHRAQQDDREAGVGGQLGRGPHPARPVVHADGRHDRRRGPGGLRAGRRLGARLRGGDRQEAVGVRHQPEGLGLAADAQRADRHAGRSTKNRVYIANGQDPEHGEGVGHFYAIDATKRGDITKTGRVWHFDKIRRSISTAAIADGLRLHPRLQRLPPLPRREDRPGVLGARHVVGRSGARRSSSTARSTSATRTATSSSWRRARRRRCSAR